MRGESIEFTWDRLREEVIVLEKEGLRQRMVVNGSRGSLLGGGPRILLQWLAGARARTRTLPFLFFFQLFNCVVKTFLSFGCAVLL